MFRISRCLLPYCLINLVMMRAGADTPAPSARVADPRVVYDGALHPDALVDAFKHSDTLFSSRLVRHGPNARVLPQAAKPLGALRFVSNGRSYDLPDYLALNRIAGLLVLKDGRIALEDYELGLRPQDRWASFSVAKSVSSTLVGIALAQGYIRSLDDPLTRYLPAIGGAGYEGVTIRNVLQMASGVAWDETYTDPKSNRRQLLDLQLAAKPGQIIKYMAGLHKAGPPGTIWNYSTGETFVIGALIEAATHRPLAQYLSETIWTQAGMESDATWWVETPGGLGAGGSGLGVTLRDFGRFGLYVLDEGRVNGHSLLPDGWFAEATRPHRIGATMVDYGYLWWPVPGGDPIHQGAFAAQGIFGQRVYVNPREKLVVVILSARPKPSADDVIDDDDFLAAVARALQ